MKTTLNLTKDEATKLRTVLGGTTDSDLRKAGLHGLYEKLVGMSDAGKFPFVLSMDIPSSERFAIRKVGK